MIGKVKIVKHPARKSYTPRPWKVINPGHGHPTEYKCVQIGADDRYTTLEMLPKDAKLIAQSPAMVEILQELINSPNRKANDLWDRAKAIVKKAL